MWDAFCMFLIFYEILIIPFKLSFEVEISSTLETIIDVLFMSDIAITFNTSIYKKGIPIFSRK
jgi:hyperpolarization activated cyclic nucleotide-gated potassium channel 2